MPKLTFEKLAALGVVGACGGLLLAYLLVVWLGIPRPATAGIDRAQGLVLWIAMGVVTLALVALHLVIARQLWNAPASRRD